MANNDSVPVSYGPVAHLLNSGRFQSSILERIWIERESGVRTAGTQFTMRSADAQVPFEVFRSNCSSLYRTFRWPDDECTVLTRLIVLPLCSEKQFSFAVLSRRKGRAAPMNRAKSLNSSNVGEKMGMCFMLGVGWLSRPVAPLSASIAGSLCQHGL